MSEENSGKVKCTRCKSEADVFLNSFGKPCKNCEKCLRYQREYNRRWFANESSDHHAARMKTLSDKYWNDEVYRERKIKAAILFSQVDSKCPACSKPMKKGSLSPHMKVCKAMYVPTVRESILRLW
jgi:DNA polymerase II small subunit/DNA polymerase delta subunit B